MSDPVEVRPLAKHEHERAIDLVERLLEELGEERADCPEIDRAAVLARWTELGSKAPAFVAVRNGELVGLLTLAECFALYANGPYGMINELYVDPALRSLGIGERLLEAAREHARARGWSRLDVTAPADARWSRTRAFYARLGFTPAGPKLKLANP